MELSEIVEKLRPFRNIVVTGPQRSGTTIATEILAYELGYTSVREEEFDVDDLVKFGAILQKDNQVIQAPGLSSVVHLLKDSSVAVVFMLREEREIGLSQRRINWTWEQYEKKKYFTFYFISFYICRSIAAIKWLVWDEQQRDMLSGRGFTLRYDCLASHPMWVAPELRKKFDHRQTKIT